MDPKPHTPPYAAQHQSGLRFPPVVQARWAELSEHLDSDASAVKAWLYTNMPLVVAVELETWAVELRSRATAVVDQARRGTNTAQRTASEIHAALVNEAERFEARAKQLRSR